MSFNKAIQRLAKPEGFEDYVQALVLYKEACSKHKRMLNRLNGKFDAASRLARADSKEEFKQACKAYTNARLRYVNNVAKMKLAEKGIDVTAFSVAKSIGIDVPVSMKSMVEEYRRISVVKGMSDEEFDAIKKAALNYESDNKYSPKRTKNQFLDNKEPKDDPTIGDFDPLP